MNLPERVKFARAMAVAAHEGQRYGKHPYSFHLDLVASLVRPWGEDACIIAYLHDTLEDTNLDPDLIQQAFGQHITWCVKLVTDPPAPWRGERKKLLHQRLSTIVPCDARALIVKAADRLANISHSIHSRSERHLDVYRAEHVAFKLACYRTYCTAGFFEEMDRLFAENPPSTVKRVSP